MLGSSDDYTNVRLSFLFLLLEEKANAFRSRGVEEGPYGVGVAHKIDVGIVGAGMGLDCEYHRQSAGVVVEGVGGSTKDLRMAVEDSPS